MKMKDFPYFWLGAEAESVPTPWRTVWLDEIREPTKAMLDQMGAAGTERDMQFDLEIWRAGIDALKREPPDGV